MRKFFHTHQPNSILNVRRYRLPLSVLSPTLYPFFRHTIANVRLAVVNTLQSFMEVSSLPHDWVDASLLRLLFQNLLSEDREDVRAASLTAWNTALTILVQHPGRIESIVSHQLIFDWYAIVMTPLGVPIDTAQFYSPVVGADTEVSERHNVDKNMLSQDLSLVTVEVTLKARLACGKALASLISIWPGTVSCFVLVPAFLNLTQIIGSSNRYCFHASSHTLHCIC